MRRTKKVVLSLAAVAMLSLVFATTARADHRSRSRGCYSPPPRHYYYSPPRYGHHHHHGGYYVPPRNYYYYSAPRYRCYPYQPPTGFGFSGRNFSFYFGY